MAFGGTRTNQQLKISRLFRFREYKYDASKNDSVGNCVDIVLLNAVKQLKTLGQATKMFVKLLQIL